MNRTSATRGVLISLSLLAVGLAALIWWLVPSTRFERFVAPIAGETPVRQSESRVSAPSPEKSASKAITEASEALKDLGDRLGPLAPVSTDPAPTFDVAQVDPEGEAVIAGRAAAGSTVELLVNGHVHDRTTADSSGAFVFVPKPLPPGNYGITLRATTPDGNVMVSKNAVAVTLRAKDGLPVAALAGPNVPAVSPAPPAAGVPPPSQPASPQSKPRDDVALRPAPKDGEIRVEAIEPEEGGGLFVSGRAAPGSRVRLYMNDGYIATGTASPEGRISFSIRSGVRPGHYRIRLDQMSASDMLVSRVEVPFRAPTTLAAPAPAAPPLPASPAPESVVASGQPELAPAASIASPAQPRGVVNEELALPAATSSEPSPSQPVAPMPKDFASGRVKEPLIRGTEAVMNPPSPFAPAQQAKPQATSEPVQAAAQPAAQPDTRAAKRDKNDASANQPSAQSPVMATPKSEPEADKNAATRMAGPTNDRRDTVVIPSIDTRLIVRGDNLWRISKTTYGFGQRYTFIFGANRDKIRDPDLIYPGQIFVLPSDLPKQ